MKRHLPTPFLSLALLSFVAGHAGALIVSSGLVDHFDADIGVTTDGSGAVVGWTNQGIGNDVTLGDPETQVLTGPDGPNGTANGKRFVRFSNPAAAPDDAGLQYAASVDLEDRSEEHTSELQSH